MWRTGLPSRLLGAGTAVRGRFGHQPQAGGLVRRLAEHAQPFAVDGGIAAPRVLEDDRDARRDPDRAVTVADAGLVLPVEGERLLGAQLGVDDELEVHERPVVDGNGSVRAVDESAHLQIRSVRTLRWNRNLMHRSRSAPTTPGNRFEYAQEGRLAGNRIWTTRVE